MKKLYLFSWNQLLKLVGLLKPLVELVRDIINALKKDKDDDNEKESK